MSGRPAKIPAKKLEESDSQLYNDATSRLEHKILAAAVDRTISLDEVIVDRLSPGPLNAVNPLR